MTEFLTSSEWYWRLARTIVQGILGVIVANIDLIVGACVAFCMAILSPIMAEIGKHLDGDGPVEIPKGV